MKGRSHDAGQSSTEFLMTFVFIFGILFIYVKIAMNFTRGYMVHFANFQASRAYLVHDNNGVSSTNSDTKADEAAKKAWKRYFGNFSGSELVSNSPDFGGRHIFIGTIVDFQQKFSFGFPFGSMDIMDLKSESFLGREPTRQVCLERICAAMRELGASSCDAHMTLSDNGC